MACFICKEHNICSCVIKVIYPLSYHLKQRPSLFVRQNSPGSFNLFCPHSEGRVTFRFACQSKNLVYPTAPNVYEVESRIFTGMLVGMFSFVSEVNISFADSFSNRGVIYLVLVKYCTKIAPKV